jgi:hypothetical protein
MRLPIKKFFIAAAALALMVSLVMVSVADAAVHVNGYYRKNGTYVAPHYRSDPDGIPTNNWSYPGNTNPVTGKTATGDPATYLQNHDTQYAGGGAYLMPGVPQQVQNVQPVSRSNPQTATAVQGLMNDTERQRLIEKLTAQIAVLQLQLQMVMLQSQMNALTGTP